MGEGKKPKSKNRHKNVKVFDKYKIEGDKISKSKHCNRCGPGTFLAQHKDRMTCGRCGFSESSKKE